MLNPNHLFAGIPFAAIAKGAKIWVAYSGGVDSHVLLHLAKQYFPHVQAIHINHNQTEQDHIWQQHCIDVTDKLSIPLTCASVNLADFAKQSMELAARNARRQIWRQYCANDYVLLAHHATDQAETILYRFVRGSGPRGLSGMQKVATLGNVTLVRPLLEVCKEEIINYAKVNNLQWLEDTTNTDINITRNFIRHEVLPTLKKRWPKVVNNINRNGKINKNFLQTLDIELQRNLQACCKDGVLDLSQFHTFAKVWQQELLHTWLKMHNVYPNAKHMQTLFAEVINARSDAMPVLKIGAKVIQRGCSKLYVIEDCAKQIQNYSLSWELDKPIQLPDGRQFSAEDIFKTGINALANKEITIKLGTIGRKAKKVFQQHAIPPWERNKYPLVFAGDRLVGIIGLSLGQKNNRIAEILIKG